MSRVMQQMETRQQNTGCSKNMPTLCLPITQWVPTLIHAINEDDYDHRIQFANGT
jgi:hypothetical protein